MVERLLAQSESVRRDGYSLLHLANRELKTRPDIPIQQQLWAFRHGYLSSSVPLYGLREDNRHEYLSQWESERARRINGELAIVHENKLLFYYVLWPPFPDSLPNLYGYLQDKRFDKIPFATNSYDSLLDCLDTVGKLVVKPVDGALGDDVHVIERTDESYLIDGRAVEEIGVNRLARRSSGHIVTEFVQQADYANEIFPDASNSIRIMTMIDPDTREPFIGALDHRFGTHGSAPVDNTAKGGLSAGVDLETGRLEAAIKPPTGETLDRFDTHPETGIPITGVEIPSWQEICDRILEMASYVAPMTPYVGWDVLVTGDDGSIVVLEANSFPDVPLQTHEPLLADERVRRFYEYHNVV